MDIAIRAEVSADGDRMHQKGEGKAGVGNGEGIGIVRWMREGLFSSVFWSSHVSLSRRLFVLHGSPPLLLCLLHRPYVLLFNFLTRQSGKVSCNGDGVVDISVC